MARASLRSGKTLAYGKYPFASGSDGEIYTAGPKSLIKLYKQPEPWRRQSLDAIIDRFDITRGPGKWESLFCWPSDVVLQPRLGVVVPRAPASMKQLKFFVLDSWLTVHPEDKGEWWARVRLAQTLCRAVRRLHFSGLAHGDLS